VTDSGTSAFVEVSILSSVKLRQEPWPVLSSENPSKATGFEISYCEI